MGGDFSLQGDQGKKVSLAEYPGKVKLVFFGFTTCPMACPATLLRLQRAFRLLEPEVASQAMVFFVSVDPERDTPAAATRYLQSFELPGQGLTGTDAELAPVVKAYAGFYRKTEDPANPIEHGLTVYLLDHQNQTRRLISSADPPEQVAAWIRALAQRIGDT